MSKISNWLVNFLSVKKNIQINQICDQYLLGKKYRVTKGTIREKTDYDEAWLLALSFDADLIFDIGCNVGQSSLLLVHNNEFKQIFLIEPNPIALSRAAQNLILNGFSSKARFICAFASDKTDEIVEFYATGSGAAGSMFSSHAKTAKKMHSSFSVPSVTVDALIKDFEIIPDLVKIDVEGAETKVLAGSQELAAQHKTRFFVEVHSSPISMSANATKIIDWCLENGYQAWYLKEKRLLNDPEQISHRGRCHLLLLPKHESFPEYLKPLKQGARLEEVIRL